MATGDPSSAATAAADAPSTLYSAAPYPERLREALTALSQACDSGVSDASEAASFTVSDTLDAAAAAIAMSAEADDGSDDAVARISEELLREVHEFLARSSSKQMAMDALSLVLPKPVAKLGAQSGGCWDIATAVLKFFVTNCSPRDMLSILCEALDAPIELPNGLSSFVLLLNALAEVLTSIQRRHVEQVKVALPAVLKVMRATVSECDEEHGKAAVDLFYAAYGIGNAIQEMCKSVVNRNKEDLCAILGLYSLQNIALLSRSRQHDILSACSIVLQHFRLLKFSGFSYLGLLTGSDVTSATDKLSKEDDADFLEYFSFAMDGAALTAVWTYMHDDVSKYADEELELALKVISMVPSSQRFDILQALVNNSMSPSLVISALNLLRFILIIDARGPRSGKLFQKETLHKVHSEWLIPLRPIVAGIQSENERDDSEIANQIVCLLNPVQLVLHRCIELVEEKMKGC
nr:unnamed protein product [Digitaria exilis]